MGGSYSWRADVLSRLSTGLSTNSTKAIGIWSLTLKPAFNIRRYLPDWFLYLGPISLKSFTTTSRSLSRSKAMRWFALVGDFPRVISGSTTRLSSLALGKEVFINPCRSSELVIWRSSMPLPILFCFFIFWRCVILAGQMFKLQQVLRIF